ncbi:putative GAL4-like Zn(II)2Cys6 (or C6 zinc) binuclear cluster DNA-binding domain [Lyophyllum shimeji]|uniref:GAL4-like Zn(II)2Cys6 (Or C6 zinc) binuclear cluster DNA-binding domain n=1 Tax=Lyophyllum shimeji TaxID=47721 RepID=A0A9P3UQA5_LYOSH|nr:putative GAL4-like Zn(II)2Cys6 (or C6 zinc) binuclear cluster DNA-binding domain [Lyophyllum shimeji]
MDPLRQPPGSAPSTRGPTRGGATPSGSDTAQPSYTSLPSIRQLHPYLPPSGLSQHQPGSLEGPPYMYAAPPQFVPHAGLSDQSLLGSRKTSEMFAIESEGDEMETSREPPKKKRRRQALSCTECKRRKIKCDRSQPCAPCTRRGEQSRCQWHIVEPTEKYVTRTEFDELKARYDELFEQVQRLQAAMAIPPYYHMGIAPGVPGAPAEAVPSFSSSGPLSYQPAMPASQAYHMNAPSQGPQRFIKSDDTQTPPRHHQRATVTSPAQSSTRPPQNDKSPTSAAARTSPLSLASITSPFHRDPQSKNCRAQTLTLGQRLRPGSQSLVMVRHRARSLLQTPGVYTYADVLPFRRPNVL